MITLPLLVANRCLIDLTVHSDAIRNQTNIQSVPKTVQHWMPGVQDIDGADKQRAAAVLR